MFALRIHRLFKEVDAGSLSSSLYVYIDIWRCSVNSVGEPDPDASTLNHVFVLTKVKALSCGFCIGLS